jgi:hypothetical protein
MVCQKQGKHTLCHEILSGILRHVVCHVGVASVLETPLRRLPGLHRGATSEADGEVLRLGCRGDILMALETGMTVVLFSVTHPASSTNLVAAAQTDGAAADKRHEAKRRAYNCLEPHGDPLVPFTVESYGRLGKHARPLLARLGQEAAESAGGASISGFVSGAIWQPSLELCRGNFYVYRDGYGLLVGALGRGLRPGMARPTEVV